METPLPISVLIATHEAQEPRFLHAALKSIWGQTSLPHEVVLVVDGPVGSGQWRVIDEFRTGAPVRFEIIQRSENGGLGRAFADGLGACTQEFVARMDADDVALPERLRVQFEYLRDHPELDLLASWHTEIDADGQDALRIKKTPSDHAAISRTLRWRCVISHPTVMFRRASVEAVGGYRPLRLNEDWDLYLRLVGSNFRLGAVQQPLVQVRLGNQSKRRGGIGLVRREVRLRRDWLRQGYISRAEFVALTVAYAAWRLVPAAVRRRLYFFVRDRPDT